MYKHSITVIVESAKNLARTWREAYKTEVKVKAENIIKRISTLASTYSYKTE